MDFVLADLIVIGLMLKLDVVVFSSQSAVDTVLYTTHTHTLYIVSNVVFMQLFLPFNL